MQWLEIKAMKECLSKLDEEMARLRVKEEDIGAQMATLSLKERELDARLVESREFSERLSWLVLCLLRGFMQQTQEVLAIRFLLSAVLFRSGRSPGCSGPNGPDVPLQGPGSGGPPSPSTSIVTSWLDAAFGGSPSPPSSPRPRTLFSKVLAGEGNSFGTAVSSFQEIAAVEEAGNRRVSPDRGESGYDGGSEASWGRVGDASYNSAPQFVRVWELQPLVVSGEGM